MQTIHTIEELIEALDASPANRFAQIVQRINIEEENLKAYASWEKGGYTRNCLMRSDAYEIILLCWDQGAKTAIHGHGGENCWVYQVDGSVEEIRYESFKESMQETQRRMLTPSKLTYMHDRMGFHAIQNVSGQRAMTLHIYASPIDRCRVYNDQKDCFEMKTMSYDTEAMVY